MEQLTTTSILSLFETTKEQRSSFVAETVRNMSEGNVDPLKVHLQVKAMEDIITQLTSTDKKKNKNWEQATEYRKQLLESASKYGKEFELHNAKFSVKETGTQYDWAACNDPVLAELANKAAIAAQALKERQEWLKNAPSAGVDILHEDEIVKVFPPVKTSTTSVSVSLK